MPTFMNLRTIFTIVLLTSWQCISYLANKVYHKEDLSCGGLCWLITKNFHKKIFEKNMFLQWFCAYIYDFKGNLEKKDGQIFHS